MARVKIEEIVDYLDSDFRKALAAAVKEVAPEATFDERTLFRAFPSRSREEVQHLGARS